MYNYRGGLRSLSAAAWGASAADVTGATCKEGPGSAAGVRIDGSVPRIGGGMQIDCGSVRIFGSGNAVMGVQRIGIFARRICR